VVVRQRVDDIIRLWHTRLFHPGRNVFQSLASRAATAMGIPVKRPVIVMSDCEACITGKMTRRSFKQKKKESDSKKQWAIGEKVHTDIWGPYHVASYSGCRYFCVFVDDASRFVTLFVLKERSEVYKAFDEYRTRIETQRNMKMKSLQSDGAKEYLKLKKHCEALGMECFLTIKKTPEQNPVAERMIRTVSEKFRCALHHGNLPQELWAEGAVTAAYVINLLPSTRTGMIAPYRLWFGRDAPLWHLRVFGCEAWVYVDTDERKKCDQRAKKMMFVGYPTDRRGYKLIDCDTLKPKYSHTVIFNEQQFPSLATPVQAHKNRQTRSQMKKEVKTVGKRDGVSIVSNSVIRDHEIIAHLYDYVLPQEISEKELHTVHRAIGGHTDSTGDSGTLGPVTNENRKQNVPQPHLISAGERTGPQSSIIEDARVHSSGGARRANT
jgi:GAG-pre-integrase domain